MMENEEFLEVVCAFKQRVQTVSEMSLTGVRHANRCIRIATTSVEMRIRNSQMLAYPVSW
jgi:hypothetical protein